MSRLPEISPQRSFMFCSGNCCLQTGGPIVRLEPHVPGRCDGTAPSVACVEATLRGAACCCLVCFSASGFFSLLSLFVFCISFFPLLLFFFFRTSLFSDNTAPRSWRQQQTPPLLAPSFLFNPSRAPRPNRTACPSWRFPSARVNTGHASDPLSTFIQAGSLMRVLLKWLKSNSCHYYPIMCNYQG